ncbi:hypothetical protein [Aquabacter spiritensis]|uniref:Uncharacterized protein n=1 Tax=Aquabacter spiritensis TaxID=933073 RepID=A0A4R3LPP9_9HYPH|nr:hypothetical protein [Aquabacter spiritensis]TCT02370.1 hypothetical protein EDC64_11313 [Aquabacter spiritensis]
MTLLVIVALLIGVGFLLATAVLLAAGMLSGRIRTAGLIAGSSGGPARIGRLQALLTSLGVIAAYSFTAIRDLSGDAAQLPDVDPVLLGALGASHLGYLGAKGLSVTLAVNPGGVGDGRS